MKRFMVCTLHPAVTGLLPYRWRLAGNVQHAPEKFWIHIKFSVGDPNERG